MCKASKEVNRTTCGFCLLLPDRFLFFSANQYISYFLHFCLLFSPFLYNFGLVSENFASPHSAVPATLICQSLDRQSICDSIELKWTVSNLISKSKSRFDERQAGRRARGRQGAWTPERRRQQIAKSSGERKFALQTICSLPCCFPLCFSNSNCRKANAAKTFALLLDCKLPEFLVLI